MCNHVNRRSTRMRAPSVNGWHSSPLHCHSAVTRVSVLSSFRTEEGKAEESTPTQSQTDYPKWVGATEPYAVSARESLKEVLELTCLGKLYEH